jgi:hypothetical protein
MVLRRLRFRVDGCRAQKVVQNLGLHSLHFQAVAASSSVEFPRAGGLAHLRQPSLKAHDTFLCCSEFLIVGYHALLKAEIGKAETLKTEVSLQGSRYSRLLRGGAL